MSSPPPSSDPRLTVAASEPRGAAEIEAALDELLDAVLSSRRTVTHLARAIATLARIEQDFVLHWAAVIARSHAEMAFQFAAAAPAALATLDLGAAEAWIIHAMDVYDREGLFRGSLVFKDPASFVPTADSGAAVAFEDVARVLQLFVQALSGRGMRLDTAAHAYTDTETLYLPTRIAQASAEAENFLLYKAKAALLWAQSRYGTYNVDLSKVCEGFADSERALKLLNALETVRLEACIARVLPGLAREMAALRRPMLDSRCARLLEPTATVHDSIAVLSDLYDTPPAIDYPYLTVLEPQRAWAVRKARIAREKEELRTALAKLALDNGASGGDADRGPFSWKLEMPADGNAQYVLKLEGEPVEPPPDLARLIDSVMQDFGEVPEEYLVSTGASESLDSSSAERESPDICNGIYNDDHVFFYNEWDHLRRHYRKNWCVLRELDVDPGDAAFVATTLAKYSAQIAQLKRMFELLRGEERVLKRQPEGDGIDLEALVEAYIDMRHGAELPTLLFTRRQKTERDLAVMFMVDMSGSTKGWVNDAEREALVMLCEALEARGDRYAIYGFSGMTRNRCEIFRVKRFDEPYAAIVRQRIAGIRPQDYTRMGAAIRHLTSVLNRVEARTKLMITLSDGKPDDYSDNYRGEYGIEDTRQALVEAHRSGIKPFCITIDREARDYLPHMYGAVNWTLVDDVTRLPLKVAQIYGRITA